MSQFKTHMEVPYMHQAVVSLYRTVLLKGMAEIDHVSLLVKPT